MASGWHILQLDHRPRSVPQLLAKYSFDISTGYTIYLTDLARVWSEMLGRRQVIKRSLEENTSIDPSEDASQLKILLDKIRVAIQGAEGTSLELLPHEGDGLVMKASAVLPLPLRPLVWPIHLELSAQELLTKELVLPLLGYHLDLRDEIESLIGQVKSKDRIIGKLLDKIEMSGMDLGTIFPGIGTGRKRGQLETAEKLVRGLGPFKRETWKEEMRVRARGTKSENEVLNAVFGSNEVGSFAVMDGLVAKADSTSNWWKNLDARPKGGSAGAEISTSGRMKAQATESESSDEFQTQETPPHLKGASKRQPHDVSTVTESSPMMLLKKPAAVDDDTTDDGLNDPSPSTATLRPGLTTNGSHKSSREGFSSEESVSSRKRIPQAKVIDGQKPNIKEQDVAEESMSSSPTQPERSGSGSETTGESLASAKTGPLLQVRHMHAASPEHRSLKSSSKAVATSSDKYPDNEDETSLVPSPSKPKSRLGAASGDQRVPNPDVNSAISSSRAMATQPLKPKARLGMIGGKKRATTPDAKLPNESSSLGVTAPPLEPKPPLGMIGKKKGVIPEDITKMSPPKSGRGGKLGLIGGRGKGQKMAAHRSSQEAYGNEEADNPQITKREGKPSPLPSPPPRPVEAPPPAPAPETEEEKANRRRDELKRQLDARSKAPAKKKRKF